MGLSEFALSGAIAAAAIVPVSLGADHADPALAEPVLKQYSYAEHCEGPDGVVGPCVLGEKGEPLGLSLQTWGQRPGASGEPSSAPH